ncbi:MAG: 3-oxoadipate enol-lactonase [Loktanella sp.]|nr:3-oxoadipate enol-lactonase [Loktanella sp.]
MSFAIINGAALHFRFAPGGGIPVVLLNSLGTDMRIWDGVIAGLPAGMPVLSIDKRGHGLSDDGPASMDQLVSDVAVLMDHLGLKGALICGVSVGGMIAQGLAIARPDLVSRLVLCCTGARIGDALSWNTRIENVQRTGIVPMADAVLDRWFSPSFRKSQAADLAGYRNMLVRTSPQGYGAVCAAIRDTDLRGQIAGLDQPAHCIAGADDLATPPDVVRALAGLIPNAQFSIIDNCGHLPCIEAPDIVANAILEMLEREA